MASYYFWNVETRACYDRIRDDYHWGDRWEELVTKYVRREGTKDKMYFPPSQEYLEDIAQIFTLSEFLQDIRKVQLQKKDYADMKVNKDFLRKYVKALKATETERQVSYIVTHSHMRVKLLQGANRWTGS